MKLLKQEPELQGIPCEQRGFQVVLTKLDELAQFHSTLCIGSTSTAYTFSELLAALQEGLRVFFIHIKAPIDSCIKRFKKRDSAAHITVSDHRLKEINEIALQVKLPWDLEIVNPELQNETNIIQLVKKLLQH